MSRANYLKPNRLEDVIILIQHLGLGPYSLAANANPEGQQVRSAKSWSKLSSEHPEFFRITQGGAVTLSYRYYLRVPDGHNPERLSIETVQELVKNAMDLHDRQAKRVEVWKTWVTMLAAVAAAATGIANLFWK
jgi:hypothetical protein